MSQKLSSVFSRSGKRVFRLEFPTDKLVVSYRETHSFLPTNSVSVRSNGYKWGGFVGYAAQYNRLYFNNCLFNPAEVSIDIDDSDDNSRTLARMYESDDTS